MEYKIGFKYGDKEYSLKCESSIEMDKFTLDEVVKDFLHVSIKGYITTMKIGNDNLKPKFICLYCPKNGFTYGTENLNNPISEIILKKLIKDL